jgi:hypothetical protein
MEHLALLIFGALALVGAAFSRLLADEFKAWAPAIVSSIIGIAVKKMPPSRRDRAAEEWTSHANEMPGDLSKVVFASGCIWAAWKIDGLPSRVGIRTLDITLAVAALSLLAPLLIFSAILIKLDSPGPTFFRANRVGANGKKFVIYKFRTMPVESDIKYPLPTKIGRWLRNGIDELPQLINVIKGDMGLIGPRPLP